MHLSQSGQDANTFESGKRVFGTEEGRVNVYRAWTASLWRDVPMGAVQIALFEGALDHEMLKLPMMF